MSDVSRSVILSLELSTNLYARDTRERCPSARFTLRTANGAQDIGALRVDVEKPELDLAEASINTIEADGVLGNVIDEAAWLAELARVLEPGGTLWLRVPASGPLAWLDAHNTYRYVGDILKRGDNPDATLPTGWNRHYAERDISALLEDAGFRGITIERVGLGIAEVPQLAGLLVQNFLRGKRDAELQLYPLRRAMERIDATIPAPVVGTALSVTATRVPQEPEDPADDAAPENQPAPEIDSE